MTVESYIILTRKPMCLDVNGSFEYGICDIALHVIPSDSIAVKIIYPVFWGLLNLRYIGKK